ncbi:MAG: MFS transporter [Candidatus Heimdallarchaeota archaeon]|nr:MFS transporter [Candidatus Heimdallarchaeota archaeon]MCK5297650.1 MFS transporter [Candidatus Heimdallarchaeota archaeon]
MLEFNTEDDDKKKPNSLFSRRLLRLYLTFSIFSFGYNFVTTAEYVNFRQIMAQIGFTSSTKISILLMCSLFALCLGTIIGGTISDSLRTRFGQRAPPILLGGLGGSLLFLLIPIVTQLSNNLDLIFAFLLLLFILAHIFIGIAFAPWLALVSDLFKKEERIGAGISINILSAAGAAIAVLIFSKLIESKLSWIIWIITGLVFGSSVIATVLLVPKNKLDFEPIGQSKDVLKIPTVIWKYGGKPWILLLLTGTLWAFSTHLVETGIVDSLIERFSISDTKASLTSNILMGAYIVVLLVPVILIINRIGKIRASILASIFYGIFCMMLSTMTQFQSIYYIVIIGGLGNIMLSTLQIALPADIAPKGREASFMGVFFVFGSIVKPFATLIQGIVLEGNVANISLSQFGGYPWVFLIAAICSFCSIFLLLLILNTKKSSKKEDFTVTTNI